MLSHDKTYLFYTQEMEKIFGKPLPEEGQCLKH